jgi:hypothetical protein
MSTVDKKNAPMQEGSIEARKEGRICAYRFFRIVSIAKDVPKLKHVISAGYAEMKYTYCVGPEHGCICNELLLLNCFKRDDFA